jgi:hypothetical protein
LIQRRGERERTDQMEETCINKGRQKNASRFTSD